VRLPDQIGALAFLKAGFDERESHALVQLGGQTVKTFVSEQWTLEFDLARNAALAPIVHRAVWAAA
jgi:hypothetical protein